MMKNSQGNKKPLIASDAIKIFEQTVLGYINMRKEGLVHRDIKTANILIGSDG